MITKATQPIVAWAQRVWMHHWSILFFLMVALVATYFSLDRRQSISTQLPLLVGLFLYVLIVDVVNTVARLRFVMVLIPVIMLFILLFLLREIFLFAPMMLPLDAVRTVSSLLVVVPNDILMLSVVMPLLLSWAWCHSRWKQVLFFVCFVCALFISDKMQSRQAVLLLLLGQMLVVGMMRPTWIVPVVLGLVGIVLFLEELLGWRLFQKSFLFPRMYVWHSAWVMFLDRPWAGQGPGVFGDLYFGFLAKAGYVLDLLPDRRPVAWSHNLYLEQLAERGVGGLVSLLSLLGVALYKACRALRCAIANQDAKYLAAGIVAAIVVLALSGIAEASLSRIWVSLVLMILAALAVAVDQISQRSLVTPFCELATTA